MTFALSDARAALINHVLNVLQLGSPFSTTFDLTPYLALLPTPQSRSDILINPLIDRETIDAGVIPAGVFNEPEDYIWGADDEGDAATLLPNEDASFEVWTSAIRRIALMRNGVQGEPGVSLFHEFKVLSALVHAASSNPNDLADGFTLISGDFPGIQKTIYTVTSEGAAKSVRGRSFFLQLLADCVVLRLLGELGGMPTTNALTIAGSKFTILAPAGFEETVQAISADINRALLRVFFGDLSLSMTAQHVSAHDLMNGRTHIPKQKQPFKALLDTGTREDFNLLFGEFGIGSKYSCAVSRREPQTPDEFDEAKRKMEQGEIWIAPENDAFRKLSEHLAEVKAPAYLLFAPNAPEEDCKYARYLHQITGWSCLVTTAQYVQRLPETALADHYILRLNSVDFDPARGHGYRYFAVHTPLTDKDDVHWWETTQHPECADREIQSDDEHCPKVGDIRSFDMIASARIEGDFVRYGILRMDVDGLGEIFGKEGLTLTRRLAMSDALSIFFEGYLPHLCREIQKEHERENGLYLLYAGGDDLFVVGEWDLLPILAERIRADFREYTRGCHTISAGIVLIPLHFPFYRAAQMAAEALESAKNHDGGRKDAICFMGVTMGWDREWLVVRNQHIKLLDIEKQIGSNAVTTNVYRIYNRWRQDRELMAQRHKVPSVYVGRYTWQAAYQMKRLSERYQEIGNDIEDLVTHLLDKDHVFLSGAAARWAEYERRNKSKKPITWKEI